MIWQGEEFFRCDQEALLFLSEKEWEISVGKTNTYASRVCALGLAKQDLWDMHWSRVIVRHVARSENLGGRVIRGTKNLGASSKGEAKIWVGVRPLLPPRFRHPCTGRLKGREQVHRLKTTTV